ncbi:MAG: adenylate/guanylate cyclase domain-containing protein [Deltaproteobacteria bacterium]|nr:MAG: adenylate/guanylate cyclase domain-containing protein [Deltaproteobacteria bacterium]
MGRATEVKATPTRWRHLFRLSPLKLALAIGIVAALVYAGQSRSGRRSETALGALEAKARDFKFRRRGPIPHTGRVAIAAIDEKSIRALGRWPWSRAQVARLVRALDEVGAAVITFDVAFVDRVSSGRFEAFREAAQWYASLAPAKGSEQQVRVDPGTMPPRPWPEFEAWLAQKMAEGDPDVALGEAILSAGRVVVAPLAHIGERPVEQSEDERAWIRAYLEPFAVRRLMREVADDGKDTPDPFPIRDLDIADALLIEPPVAPVAAASPFIGFFNVEPDPDGVLRRAMPMFRYEDLLLPSIDIESVAVYLNSRIYPFRDFEYGTRRLARITLVAGTAEYDGEGVFQGGRAATDWVERRAEGLRVSEREDEILRALDEANDIDVWLPEGVRPEQRLEIPLDPFDEGMLLVNYPGPRETYTTVSAVDVIEGKADPALLRDRIVIVAATAMGTFDQRVTPYDAMVPGAYQHAAVVDTILSGRFITRPLWWLEPLLLVALCLLLGLVMPRLPNGYAVGAFVVLTAGSYYALDLWLFSEHHVDLFLVTPLGTFLGGALALSTYQWLVVDREKRQVRRAFQHYLAPSVMQKVLEDPEKLKLAPGKAELTVLFSDIRGFTTISERLPPEQLAVVLNEYLTPMTHIVFEHGGTLDKYMGDAIMAFYGDPVPQPDHALRACKTAVRMIEKLDELSAVFEARGWPPLDIGIGINTGPMSVGNFGSDVLFDYTVMGDAVNLASRLEGTNKQYGTRILISEATLAHVRDQVIVRELDSVRVKGKREPVRIYELMGLGQPDAETRAFLEAFAEGLAHYRRQLWDDAIAHFERAGAMRPLDIACQLYVARCVAMKESPPGEDWDGVYTMTSK